MKSQNQNDCPKLKKKRVLRSTCDEMTHYLSHLMKRGTVRGWFECSETGYTSSETQGSASRGDCGSSTTTSMGVSRLTCTIGGAFYCTSSILYLHIAHRCKPCNLTRADATIVWAGGTIPLEFDRYAPELELGHTSPQPVVNIF